MAPVSQVYGKGAGSMYIIMVRRSSDIQKNLYEYLSRDTC